MQATSTTTGRLAFSLRTIALEPPIRSLKEPKHYDFLGLCSSLLPRLDEVASLIYANVQDQEPCLPKIKGALTSFVEECWYNCTLEKQACWFHIGMTTGQTLEERQSILPRWHIDGFSFSPRPASTKAELQSPPVYAVTLPGPSTVFLETFPLASLLIKMCLVRGLPFEN